MAKSTRKHVCRQSLAVLVSLFLIGNVAHGTVLCFGSDGHIEFESAFHIHRDDYSHAQSSEHVHPFFETDHQGDVTPGAGPCVDVPITADIVKTLRESDSSDCVPAAAESTVASGYFNPDRPELNPSHHMIIPNACRAPLRTVILLI